MPFQWSNFIGTAYFEPELVVRHTETSILLLLFLLLLSLLLCVYIGAIFAFYRLASNSFFFCYTLPEMKLTFWLFRCKQCGAISDLGLEILPFSYTPPIAVTLTSFNAHMNYLNNVLL